jgi:Trypsin-co-occurring domain 1
MDDRTQKVRIQLPTGVIWAEVEPVGPVTNRRDVAADDEAEPLSIDVVRTAVEGLSRVVQEALAAVKPDKASAEFSLEVGVESGKLTALWVKGSGKANLKITLTWGK